MRGGMNCTTVDPMAHWLTLQIPEPFRAAVMIEVGRLARRAQLESSDTTAKRTANGPKPIGSRQSTLSPGRKSNRLSSVLRGSTYTPSFEFSKTGLVAVQAPLLPHVTKTWFYGAVRLQVSITVVIAAVSTSLIFIIRTLRKLYFCGSHAEAPATLGAREPLMFVPAYDSYHGRLTRMPYTYIANGSSW